MQTRRSDILIVDDLPEKHLVYRTILEPLNENLVSVASGEEALSKLLQQDFALILLDVNMPGLSGHETAKLIRARRKSRFTPIIFVTAFADDLQTAEGYALGAVDYIMTPVVAEVLRAKVQVFVDLDKVRSELAASHALLEMRVEERTAEIQVVAKNLEIEIQERKRTEERLTVLVKELSHRVKNLLAVLNSLVSRTLTNSRSTEEAKKILSGRILALGRAHELLTDACWSGADLKQIVFAELAGFSERITARGPDVRLTASAVQTFALILHELSTNAAKYGSLSNDNGEVVVDWSVSHNGSDQLLDFRWQEQGGPMVKVNETKGFGLSLINAMGRSLTGEPAICFHPHGLECRMKIGLEKVVSKAVQSMELPATV
jgi:two-component sensor histidine kinase